MKSSASSICSSSIISTKSYDVGTDSFFLMVSKISSKASKKCYSFSVVKQSCNAETVILYTSYSISSTFIFISPGSFSMFFTSSVYFIRLWSFFITLASSASSSCFFISALKIELYLFLTVCSVLVFPIAFAIVAHFFPSFKTESISMKSYDNVHFSLDFPGSRWFIHLYLHCLGVLKYFLLDSMKSFLAISLHLYVWIGVSKVVKWLIME